MNNFNELPNLVVLDEGIFVKRTRDGEAALLRHLRKDRAANKKVADERWAAYVEAQKEAAAAAPVQTPAMRQARTEAEVAALTAMVTRKPSKTTA